jgi:hypothetical protein
MTTALVALSALPLRADTAFDLAGGRRGTADMCGWKQKYESESRPRINGSGLFTVQLTFLDRDLLHDIVRYEKDLLGRTFDFGDNHVTMFGMLGYVDVGSGVRLGGGGWGGYRRFDSDQFTRILTDSLGDTTHEYDAVATLRVIPAYGGFVFEKAFDFGRFNVFGGALLGSGLLIIHKQFRQVEDIFVSSPNDSLDWTAQNNGVAVAPLMVGDIHGGLDFALSRYFQLGADASVMVKYANNGFVSGTGFGDFYTVEPGIRLRFIFGKAI